MKIDISIKEKRFSLIQRVRYDQTHAPKVKWPMAHCYDDYTTRECVLAPLGLHWLVIAWHLARLHYFNHFMMKKSPIDLTLDRLRGEAERATSKARFATIALEMNKIAFDHKTDRIIALIHEVKLLEEAVQIAEQALSLLTKENVLPLLSQTERDELKKWQASLAVISECRKGLSIGHQQSPVL
jgi:hypothetical protein